VANSPIEYSKFESNKTFNSFVLGLLYITSTNSFFIKYIGFEFNPSKLILLFILPLFLIIIVQRANFSRLDLYFGLFILLATIFAIVRNSPKVVTSLSNFLFPYICFKYFTQRKLSVINLKLLVNIILVWTLIHCLFGFYQFYTGDRSLVFFKEIQEYKLKYAQEYAFNPFGELKLLPHGLYNYSSVFSISLIFPFFILLSYYKQINKLFFFPVFIAIVFDVFVCFSRFEIISVFFSVLLAIFVIKDKKINNFILNIVLIGFALVVLIITIYFYTVLGSFGTIEARVITISQLQLFFDDITIFLFGGDSYYFTDVFKVDIPHNVFVYTVFSFGIFCAIFVFMYFIKYGFSHYKYVINRKVVGIKSQNLYKPYAMVSFFYLYVFFLRGFDYYIFDGYESVFLIFLCLIILDTYKKEFIALDNEIRKKNIRL
jgi:hypothetical protein